MRYMMLIYGDEAAAANTTPEEWEAVMNAHYAFGDEGRKRGILLGGEALQPTAQAVTLRKQNGEYLTTDGPFAETKEQLGGYYLFKCDSPDEIIELAKLLPLGDTGSIEIRPIVEFE